MAQYIDKAAVVAEIERRTKEHHSGYLVCLKDILSFLDTLEVKEIDFDLGSPNGDIGVKTIWDGDKVVSVSEPSNNLEEAARRIATRHSHITGDTYYANDAWFFKKGAQWQKKQMIDKACKWLKSYRQDTPDGTGYVAGIVNDKTIEEFKQAMEE